jgi:hypothetical protein
LRLDGLFSLAFTTPPTNVLSLPQQITRWIVLQKARRHRINRLRLLVRTQFQDLFHSPSGVLLTFPSRYLYTIDRKIYLALEGGPSSFNQGFTCPGLLDNTDDKVASLCVPGYHSLWRHFPEASAYNAISYFMPAGGSAGFLLQATDINVRFLQKVIYMSQPPHNIRLPTYSNFAA